MNGLAVLIIAGLLAGAAADVSQQQAAAFQKKLARIVAIGTANAAAKKAPPPQQTIVTNDELNSYLRFSAGEQLPVGVTEPSMVIQGGGRVSGRAVADLDIIRKKKGTGGWLDPTSYLTGRLPVTASGVLRTEDGRGRFELSSAEVGGIPIPKSFLQEIVSFYTRTAEHPSGITIDQAFELPAKIRRIDSTPGRAVIVQ